MPKHFHFTVQNTLWINLGPSYLAFLMVTSQLQHYVVGLKTPVHRNNQRGLISGSWMHCLHQKFFLFLLPCIILHLIQCNLMSFLVIGWPESLSTCHPDTSVLPVPRSSVNFVSMISRFYAEDTAVNIKHAQFQLWTTPRVASHGADYTSPLLTPLSKFPVNSGFGFLFSPVFLIIYFLTLYWMFTEA